MFGPSRRNFSSAFSSATSLFRVDIPTPSSMLAPERVDDGCSDRYASTRSLLSEAFLDVLGSTGVSSLPGFRAYIVVRK